MFKLTKNLPAKSAFAACLALASAFSAQASPDSALQNLAARPLAAMFPMLDQYLRMPPGDRAAFRVRYCAMRLDGVREGVRVRFITSIRDVTLDTDEFGCFAALPGLEDLRANPTAIASVPESALKIVVAMEPAAALKRVMAIQDLRDAIAQADASARAAAGMLSWGAPHLDSVHFDLEASGQNELTATASPSPGLERAGYAVFADGRRVSLPLRDGRVMVAPNDPQIRDAYWVEFSANPVTARIGFSAPLSR